MEDEVVGSLLMGFVAVQEEQDILLREAVIAHAEGLTETQRFLETVDSRFGAGDLDLVSARHDAYVGVLVLETEDVGVIHTVEGRCIQGIVERNDLFHPG